MASQVTISVDAMGGDHGPPSVVDGVALAAQRHGRAVRFLLHGDERALQPLLALQPQAAAVSEVRHTDTYVTMTDKPSEAIRRSRGSSMWNAVAAVKEGEAHAAVSAGNTGALMAISKVLLRMTPHAHRPAIAASWPTPQGRSVVLDVGANVECGARQLVEFAIMGEAFFRAVYGVRRPTVGLLNVGQEDMKGHETVRAAAELFRSSAVDLAYHGFVEGDDISLGAADVVVTDGFTGNVALKTAEGAAKLVGGWLREALTRDWLSKMGAVLSRQALMSLKDKMDPRHVNGGVFLGLNGVVVKSHGGADSVGFATALTLAFDLARSDFIPEVTANLARFAAHQADADAAVSASAEATAS